MGNEDPFIKWLDERNLTGEFFGGDYDEYELIWKSYVKFVADNHQCENTINTSNIKWYHNGKLEKNI